MAAKAKTTFDSGFNGKVAGDRGETHIGVTGNTFQPYELLYGALSSCVHATVLGVARKMRLEYETAEYDVTGTKRSEVPTFLTNVYVKVTMTGVTEENQKKMTKAITLGTEYCSIYNTLAKVAEMHLEIEYK